MLYANLKWEKKELIQKVKYGETSIKTLFNFQNPLDEAVEILGIDTSCGCTVPKLKKMTYAPGEKGTLEIMFNPSKRKGIHKKYIWIETIGLTLERTRLSIIYDIYEPISLSEYILQWEPEEYNDIQKKMVFIEIHDKTIQVERPSISNDSFSASLEKIGDYKYKLEVFPVPSMNHNSFAILTFETKNGSPSLRYSIRLEIKNMQPQIGYITSESLRKSLENKQNIIVIDARDTFRYNKGHIRNALSLPLKDFDIYIESFLLRMSQFPVKIETLIVYCEDERCDYALKLAQKLSFTNKEILILKGGWSEWNKYILNGEDSL